MLYQLTEEHFKYLNYKYVIINGPFDKYGKIIGKKENGIFLIRGIGKEKPIY